MSRKSSITTFPQDPRVLEFPMPEQSNRPLEPYPSPLPLSLKSSTEGQPELFRFGTNGYIEWAEAADQPGDMSSIWSLDTEVTSDVDLTTSWLNNDETMPISLSPSQLAVSFPAGRLRGQSTDFSVKSSFSDPDLGTQNPNNKKARRQAQNRQAQRAYRARKEKELDKSRVRIRELETEVQRAQKALGSSETAVFREKIVILEKRNQELHIEAEELRAHLRRIAEAMIGSGLDRMLSTATTS